MRFFITRMEVTIQLNLYNIRECFAKLMRIIINNAGAIAFGLVVGFFIASVSGPNKWTHWTDNKETALVEQQLDNVSIAMKLSKEVRVLCCVMTTRGYHQAKALHVKNTWGRRCNKLLFMSTLTDSVLGSIALNITDDRDHLWEKTRLSFEYIYKNHLNDYDWFLKTDDDTYVIMENLRYLLYPYSTEDPIYFGKQFQISLTERQQIYMSGGAGYVLSREAVRRLVEKAIHSGPVCPTYTGPEDVNLGYCLSDVNVRPIDTRDSDGRDTFFPFEPVAHLIPKNDWDYWYNKNSVFEPKTGPQCCSDNAISFHYVKANDMYVLDYLILSLQPFGIARLPELLNKSLTVYKQNEISNA